MLVVKYQGWFPSDILLWGGGGGVQKHLWALKSKSSYIFFCEYNPHLFNAWFRYFVWNFKGKKNPSRTVDATEGTRFSKSRPNDLEDIGQGQSSSHATHPLMLLIICTKYGKNPVDATGRTRKVNRQTDRRTDGQTDRVNPIYPPNFVAGVIMTITFFSDFIKNTYNNISILRVVEKSEITSSISWICIVLLYQCINQRN